MNDAQHEAYRPGRLGGSDWLVLSPGDYRTRAPQSQRVRT
jgi:hypothetical protein